MAEVFLTWRPLDIGKALRVGGLGLGMADVSCGPAARQGKKH